MEWLKGRADELPSVSASEVLARQSTCAEIRQQQPWVPLKLQMPYLLSLVNHVPQLFHRGHMQLSLQHGRLSFSPPQIVFCQLFHN